MPECLQGILLSIVPTVVSGCSSDNDDDGDPDPDGDGLLDDHNCPSFANPDQPDRNDNCHGCS